MTGGYVKTYVVDVNTSHTPEEGAHSPTWPNGLVIINIIKFAKRAYYHRYDRLLEPHSIRIKSLHLPPGPSWRLLQVAASKYFSDLETPVEIKTHFRNAFSVVWCDCSNR
jgi:hypothetical protein